MNQTKPNRTEPNWTKPNSAERSGSCRPCTQSEAWSIRPRWNCVCFCVDGSTGRSLRPRKTTEKSRTVQRCESWTITDPKNLRFGPQEQNNFNQTLHVGRLAWKVTRVSTSTLRWNVSVSASIDFVEKRSMFYCLLISNVLWRKTYKKDWEKKDPKKKTMMKITWF